MTRNKRSTSKSVATLAGETLSAKRSSEVAKKLAAPALTQAGGGKETGAQMEDIASKVLRSEKYGEETKSLAGSVLSQSNTSR